MAVYIDTEQVAGIAGIPSLTLEQYNALEVKPKLWFLLNPPEEYQRLSADEVSYDGTSSRLSATNTQGAIDEVNERLTTVKDNGSISNLFYGRIKLDRVYNMGANKTLTITLGDNDAFCLIVGVGSQETDFIGMCSRNTVNMINNRSGWTMSVDSQDMNKIIVKSPTNWCRYVILSYGEFTCTTSA